MLQKEQLKPTVIHAIAIMNSEIQVINAFEVSYPQLFGIFRNYASDCLHIYRVYCFASSLYWSGLLFDRKISAPGN